jgi:acyl dehydratase
MLSISALPSDLLVREVDLGETLITAEAIRRYATVVGIESHAPPLSFCLVLRRGFSPHLEIPTGVLAVHGGHDIRLHAGIHAGSRYRVSARVVDVVEKKGRSGRLVVVTRRASIRATGAELVAEITDRQILRPRPTSPARAPAAHPPSDIVFPQRPPALLALEMGESIGPLERIAPTPEEIAAWADLVEASEPQFMHPEKARDMGYAGVIVPGPFLSACFENLLAGALPDWTLTHLGTTFRLPVLAGEVIRLSAVATELPEPGHAICDLLLENSEGERAVTGVAEVWRRKRRHAA